MAEGDFSFEGAYVSVAMEVDKDTIQQNLEDGLKNVPIPTANAPENTYTQGFFAGLGAAATSSAGGINWSSIGTQTKPQVKVDKSALDAAIKKLQADAQKQQQQQQRPQQPLPQQQQQEQQPSQPVAGASPEDCQCDCCDPGEQQQVNFDGNSTTSSSSPTLGASDLPGFFANLSNGNSQGGNSELSSPPSEGVLGGYESLDPNVGQSASEYLNGPSPTNMDSESSLPEANAPMNSETGGMTVAGMGPEEMAFNTGTTPEEADAEMAPPVEAFDPNSFDYQG